MEQQIDHIFIFKSWRAVFLSSEPKTILISQKELGLGFIFDYQGLPTRGLITLT